MGCDGMYTPQVLPYAFDGKITYMEQLYKLCQELNDLRTQVETMEARIMVKVGELFAAQDAKVDAKLAEFKKQIDDALRMVSEMIKLLEERVDTKIKDNEIWVANEIFKIRAYVDGQIINVREYAYQMNVNTMEYVDDEIRAVIEMIPEITSTQVRSPFSGEIVGIQKYVDDADNYYRVHGLTVRQYDRATITFREYNRKQIGYIRYNREAWLGYEVWNQMVGDYTTTRKYLDGLFAFHSTGGITYGLYNYLKKTKAEYDALGIQFRDYVLDAKRLLHADMYRGITMAEFDAKNIEVSVYDALGIEYDDYNYDGYNVLIGVA